MTEKNDNLILSIEAAVSGGSISLLKNGVEIAMWIGTAGMARAENLLADIDKLLEEKRIPIGEIDVVAVSAGPGSFTGIRIGFSTALGLSAGLGIDLASVSALKAMAHQFPGCSSIITAVPTGRDAICFQEFDTLSGLTAEISEPETQRETDFVIEARARRDTRFVLHDDVFEKLSERSGFISFGRNIARAIGTLCGSKELPRTEPLFISKSF